MYNFQLSLHKRLHWVDSSLTLSEEQVVPVHRKGAGGAGENGGWYVGGVDATSGGVSGLACSGL